MGGLFGLTVHCPLVLGRHRSMDGYYASMREQVLFDVVSLILGKAVAKVQLRIFRDCRPRSSRTQRRGKGRWADTNQSVDSSSQEGASKEKERRRHSNLSANYISSASSS